MVRDKLLVTKPLFKYYPFCQLNLEINSDNFGFNPNVKLKVKPTGIVKK